jgi:hypothetical protein
MVKRTIVFILFVGNVFAQQSDLNFIFDQKANAQSAIELTRIDTTDIGAVIYAYQSQIEYALTWRSIAINTYESFSNKKVLQAADLNYLNYAIEQYKNMRSILFEGIARYAPLTNETVSLKLYDKKPSQFYHKKKIRALWGGPPQEIMLVNPNDEAGQSVIKQLKLGLVFGLLLYDNYLVAMAPFEKNEKLRFILNETGIQSENRGYLTEVSESYTDTKKMGRMIRAVKFIYQESKWELRNPNVPFVKDDPDNYYLNQLILGSLSFREMIQMEENDLGPKFKFNRMNVINNKLSDRIRKISNNAAEQVSKMFGNTAGMIVTRNGIMAELPKNEERKITLQMAPMDILLEKAPFRLTDYFIPGYWCHVGIWTGSEAELKALDVWDDLPKLHNDAVEKYGYSGSDFQTAIRTGHQIIEALRPGVQINTFQHFLNIDDLGVIRFKGQSDEQKKAYLLNAFRQIGKNYDFSFDVESTEEIVCSELVYVAFDDLVWDTSKSLGRYTISPDQVARKLADESFEPVLLFLNGRSVDGDLRKKFNSLLE